MIRALAAAVIVIATSLFAVAPSWAAAGDVAVTIDPDTIELRLGEETTLSIEVRNDGSSPTGRLAVHIDVTDPGGSASVDPEDWSATLTRRIDSLDPGAARTLEWRLQPISGGTFRAYAVALPVDGGTDVWASNGITIRVQEHRSLNPEGVLPVAVGAPVVVGLLLATRLRRRPAG